MPIIPGDANVGTGPLQGVSGLEGDAPVAEGVGVRGKNDFLRSKGFLAGQNPFARQQALGVFGEGPDLGVVGIADNAAGVGVYGGSIGGAATGVVGETST